MTEEWRSATSLPARADVVLRGGYVLSMDSDIGDLPHGDVWIRDGEIAGVGRNIEAPGAEEVDARHHIVIPGLIDTHWHLWNSLFRGVVSLEGERRYFPVKRRLASLFTPADSYRAARLGLAEALESGITTVTNWDHNLRSPEDADANLLAHLDSGLRCRLSYGNPDAFDPSRPMDFEDVVRVKDSWLPEHSDEGRLDLGLALRGPTRTDRAIMFAEWEFARDQGLPITMHLGGRRSDVNRYADIMAMHGDGLLGPDVQFVHAIDANEEELRAMAETGTTLSLSPVTELKSMDLPPLGPALAAGVGVSLSIDTLAAPTNADMFHVMRLAHRLEHHRDRASGLSERRVLELATIDGARDLGMDDVIGSLVTGKRADVVAVRADSLAMAPGMDPIQLLVHAARPSDVALVAVDGRVLKLGAAITFFDSTDVVAEARTATSDLLARSGWELGDEIGQV